MDQKQNKTKEIMKKVLEIRKYLRLLYEDKIKKIISLEQFRVLVNDYNNNEIGYNEQIKFIDNEIEFYKKKGAFVGNMEKMLNKYRKVESLNKIIVDEFIDKIYIGKFDGEKRNIYIEWNFK
jgi:hypothetical protein